MKTQWDFLGLAILWVPALFVIALITRTAIVSNDGPKPMLCDETDEAVILKSEGWRARTAVDVPWIVDAAKKGWLEFEERPTLECYEPLHPDKRTVMNQFWWRAKVKKSGFPDVTRRELRPT